MLLIADPETAFVDPCSRIPTLSMICNVLDPVTREPYTRDPRYIAQKAERYLTSTGIADTSYWGPEAEFYIFDDVRFDQTQHCGYYYIDSIEGVWNSGREDGRRQPRLQAAAQGGLLPGAADRQPPGHPLGDDAEAERGRRRASRSTTTRSAPPARARSTCGSAR